MFFAHPFSPPRIGALSSHERATGALSTHQERSIFARDVAGLFHRLFLAPRERHSPFAQGVARTLLLLLLQGQPQEQAPSRIPMRLQNYSRLPGERHERFHPGQRHDPPGEAARSIRRRRVGDCFAPSAPVVMAAAGDVPGGLPVQAWEHAAPLLRTDVAARGERLHFLPRPVQVGNVPSLVSRRSPASGSFFGGIPGKRPGRRAALGSGRAGPGRWPTCLQAAGVGGRCKPSCARGAGRRAYDRTAAARQRRPLSLPLVPLPVWEKRRRGCRPDGPV